MASVGRPFCNSECQEAPVKCALLAGHELPHVGYRGPKISRMREYRWDVGLFESKDWIEDCMKHYGRILTGEHAHWCHDWDEMPIDDTCDESAGCTCSWDFEIKSADSADGALK